jgi:hypothetical protein
MTKKKGGLGASAWFDNTPIVSDATDGAPIVTQKEARTPKKTRKTFVILPDTYYILGRLKAEAQRGGEGATLGDLLDEAVQDLAAKKGLMVEQV